MEMSSKTGVDAYMEVAKKAHSAALDLATHALSEYNYGLFGSLKGILAYYEAGAWNHLNSVALNCIELARMHG